ncbi:MAG: glycosyltransferase family 1 protein [Frankiales bacterium]|nr:glycosyltransferase family 1 protein [Frankiales bacterium]
MGRQGKIAFCPARYGPDIVGGAEIVMRELARRLHDRGWDVEVLTTTALDHFSWANELPAGTHEEDGLVIRRFPVQGSDSPERAGLEAAIISGASLSLQEQQRWMNGGMRIPEMYHYLLDSAKDYRALVFGPYPFWPAFACAQIAPEKTLLWSCLHDEPYARLELFDPVFSGSAGLFFMAEPEQRLAESLFPNLGPHAEVGCGVEVPEHYDPEGFRARHGLTRPFLLYAGRREGAKGWDELLQSFARATVAYDLPFDLVTMGRGEVRPPPEVADRVIDLGFLPDDERDHAFAAAAAYVQPSRFEAFSRTIMEAWLAGTPVIANAGSDVVAWHCARSGAGLVYDDDAELEQCLVFLADEPEAAARLAEPGRQYVLDHYTWDVVLDRVEVAIEAWTSVP